MSTSSVPRTTPRAWLLAAAAAAAALTHAATSGDLPARAAARPAVLEVVTLGDSTTASARDWAPEIEEVYSDCLPRELAPHGLKVVVHNAGIGDTTTRDAVARLDRDVRPFHPALVVVQFGINDSWIDVDQGRTRPRLTRAEYRRNLRTIIDRLRRDGSEVVVMTPNPMRWHDPFYIKGFREHPGLLDVEATRGLDRLLDLYAADARAVAARAGVPLVDVWRAFEDYGAQPGQRVDDLLLASDGIHPNQAGQHLVCRILAARIAELTARP